MSELPLLQRKSKIFIAILLVLLFVILLLVKMPAKIIFSAARAAGVPLHTSGVSGTLWHGHANRLAIPIELGEYWQLGVVNWQLEALPLLIGHIDIVLDSRFEAQKLNIEASLNRNTLVLRRADIHLPAPVLSRMFPMLPALGGTLVADIEYAEVDYSNLALQSLEGTLWWRGLSVDQGGSYILLGDYRADVRNLNDGVMADIKDLEAALAVNGTLAITGARDYQVDLSLQPKGDLEPSVQGVLSLIAPQQDDGSYQLKQKGTL